MMVPKVFLRILQERILPHEAFNLIFVSTPATEPLILKKLSASKRDLSFGLREQLMAFSIEEFLCSMMDQPQFSIVGVDENKTTT